jgi:E3 ubiquitin-protein ligase UBR7
VSCHTDHDVVELDYKRSFRCDCGTSKCPAPCSLKKGPAVEDSTNNVYNHNFDGTFCHCALPFNEDEEDEDTTMIQCLVCEDWFHDRCLSQV